MCSIKSISSRRFREQTFVLLTLQLMMFWMVTDGAISDGSKSRPVVACEGQQLGLQCQQGEVIRIDRANYGRFTISVCNDHGQTEGWNLQCLSPNAKDIISERCDGRQVCDMFVSNDVFGDPCPLTFKYAEVGYTCNRAPHGYTGTQSTMTAMPNIHPKMPLNESLRPPHITSAIALNPNQIEIVWTQAGPPTPIHSTVVYIKNIATLAELSPIHIDSGKSVIINSLTPNTTYSIFLKSFSSFGPSISSHTVIVTTPPAVLPGEIQSSSTACNTPHPTSNPSFITDIAKELSTKLPPNPASKDEPVASSNTQITNILKRIFTSMFSSNNATHLNLKSGITLPPKVPPTTISEGTQLSAFIRVASSSGGENTDHRNNKKHFHHNKERVKESLQDSHYRSTSPVYWNSNNNFQNEADISGVSPKMEKASLNHLKENETSQNINGQSEFSLPQQIVLAVSPTLESDVTENIKMELRKSVQDLTSDKYDKSSPNDQLFTNVYNFNAIKDSPPQQNGKTAMLDSPASVKNISLVQTVSNDSTKNVGELPSRHGPLLQRVIENDGPWQEKVAASDSTSLISGHRQFGDEKSYTDAPTYPKLESKDNMRYNMGSDNNGEYLDRGKKQSHEFESGNLMSDKSAILSSLNQSLSALAMETEILSVTHLYQAPRAASIMDKHILAPQMPGANESSTKIITSRINTVTTSPDGILIHKIDNFTRRSTFSPDLRSRSTTATAATEPITLKPEMTPPIIDTSSNDRSSYKPQVLDKVEVNEIVNGVVDTFCEEMVHKGVKWHKTRFGRLAEATCPGHLRGMATWRCLSYGWDRSGPDTSDCISAWVEKIDAQIQRVATGQESADEAAISLDEATRDQDLTPGDLRRASIKLLPSLAQGFQLDDPFEPLDIKIQKMKKFKKAFISASSNLLSERNVQSWKNVSRQDQKMAATSLILAVEDTGFRIASLIEVGGSVMTVDTNLIMQVNVIDTKQDNDDFMFPSKNDLWEGNTDLITITSNGLRTVGLNGPVNVVFTLYKNMETLMQPQSNTISSISSSSIPSKNDDYDYAGIIKDSIDGQQTSTIRVINTNIIAASVNSAKQRSRLTEPVIFTLRHLEHIGGAHPVCSYWDMDTSYQGNRWSTDGCRLLNTNTTHTTCECDHLTNFAVLMDVTGVKLLQEHVLALRVITYVGCIISVICLLLSWLTFLVFKNLQCDRNTIHKNLVLCLLLAEIVFLAGIAQTEPQILCSIIACILHYLFLGAFAWMCLEGIQLYVMLVEVFEQEKSRVHLYYVFGYGIPAIIVSVSAGVYHQGYGTARHCWLTTENYFIWSFVGPALAVMMINIVMLSIAIYIMCRHSNMSATMRERSKATKFSITESFSSMETFAPPKLRFPDLPAWLKGAIVLVVLLGLTWLLGVLYLNEESVVMAYFFTVFNSLQGMFIFVFHCLKNEKVQKEYRKVARRTSWLPNCIRVNYGGYTGVASSSPIGSSGSGNYLSKLFGPKNRNSAASTNNSAKPFLSNNQRRSETENSSSKDSSNVPSSLNGYVYNPSYSTNGSSKTPFLNGNGVMDTAESGQAHVTNNYERVDELALDLSEFVDCSVVDSEFVSEYCKHNMQISREEQRYSTGSEDSDSRKPVIQHNVELDNLSTASLPSSCRKPSSCVSSSEALSQSLDEEVKTNLGEMPRKETIDPRINLHQYLISAPKKSSNSNNNNNVQSINEKPRSDNIVSSMNKLSKPIPSLSSIPEAQTSPQHSSAPNLQVKLNFTDKISESSAANSPENKMMTHSDSSEPVYEEVQGSATLTKSILPNLSLNGLTVDCSDNTDFNFPIVKHSSETDVHFSPFKFSTSHC